MKPPERILVCGGRYAFDTNFIFATLDEYRKFFAPVFCIIQGEARGTDYIAKCWAKRNGIACIGVEANWDFYDKSAGPTRNYWMTQFCSPELILAFPGNKGTENMVQTGKRLGITTHRIIAPR